MSLTTFSAAARHHHHEHHATDAIGWLRAAILGANDGLLSTASLIVGVASASADRGAILLAGGAGLIAGALSMAAGEYVSVSSQADLERADLAREAAELAANPHGEERELVEIYRARGVSRETAEAVSRELMAHDALHAHARDELGLTEANTARPVQAAIASAVSFATGAALPLLAASVTPAAHVPIVVLPLAIAMLALLGAVGARTGNAPLLKPVLRITVLGAAAMLLTLGIGRLLGATL